MLYLLSNHDHFIPVNKKDTLAVVELERGPQSSFLRTDTILNDPNVAHVLHLIIL